MRETFNQDSKKPVSKRRRKNQEQTRDAALYNALCLGQSDKIPMLLKTGGRPDRILASITKDDKGRRYKTTALHMAVMRDDDRALRAFVRSDANIDVLDLKGQTPLHMACAAGNLLLVAILLDAGADRTIKNKLGHTPQEAASKEMAHRAGGASLEEGIVDLFKQADIRDMQGMMSTSKHVPVMTPVQFKPGTQKPPPPPPPAL